MYDFPLPLLIISSPVKCAICINGTYAGFTDKNNYCVYPIGSEGKYFVTAFPCKSNCDYLIKTSEVVISGSTVISNNTISWQSGVYELRINPTPIYPQLITPHTICTQKFMNKILSLYYENGIKFAYEDNQNILNAFALGSGNDGSISIVDVGDKSLAYIHIKLFVGERLIVLSPELETLIDLSGDKIIVSESVIHIINYINNSLSGYEKRTIYEYVRNDFITKSTDIGFFTHEKYKCPISVYFLESLMLGVDDEAMKYLSAGIKSSFTVDSIKDFLGQYNEVRLPYSDNSGAVVGLISGRNVKMFEFETDSDIIVNLSEL